MRLIDIVNDPETLQFFIEEIPPGKSVSMTDATEIIFGSSGRGNKKAVLVIETMAKQGKLTITGGKRRRVSVPDSVRGTA